MSIRYSSGMATIALALLTFWGTLADQTTNQPLSGVRVETSGPTRALATSDGRGRFRLDNLRPGRYVITIRSNDVPRQTFPFTITTNTTRTIKACSTTLDYHCGSPGGGGY